MKRDRIFIIGAGAVGRALAVFLKQVGKNVVLLRGHTDDEPTHFETISIELGNGVQIRSDVEVSSINAYSTISGIIVLATKSFGNKQIADRLKGKTNDSPIVVLQNGLDVEDAFIANAFPEIYRCVLFTSCQIAEGHLRFKPVSASLIGVIRGTEDKLKTIVASLANPHFVFQAEKNIQAMIWEKAIINSVFNAVCPLLEMDNGIFHRHEPVLAIARSLIEECLPIAAAEGIELQSDQVLEKLLLISKASDGQLISTYQDLIHKRRTEIETLNLAIARKAEKLQSSGLVSMTWVLGKLVYIKSEQLRCSGSLDVINNQP